MHITTTDELIAALLDVHKVTAKDSQSDDEDAYDAIAVTLQRLIDRLDKERSKTK